MLYLAVRLDSSNLCEVHVTSGKDETDFYGRISTFFVILKFSATGRAVRFLCTSAQEKTALGPEPYWHSFAATAFRASTPASVLPACHFWTAVPSADNVEVGEGTAGIAQVGGSKLEIAINCDRLPCLFLPRAMISPFHLAQPLHL